MVITGRGGPIGFFFSSIGRHTRYWRDWSSDLCSSDLRHVDHRLTRARIRHDDRLDRDRGTLAEGDDALHLVRHCFSSVDVPEPAARPVRPARRVRTAALTGRTRSEEHTSELQSRQYLVCRLLLEKKKTHE